MDMWRVMSMAMVLGVGASMLGRNAPEAVWAADHDDGTVEAAEMGAERVAPKSESNAAREQMMQRIELLRQVDPALAEKMENQVEAIETGIPLSRIQEQRQLDRGIPSGDAPAEEAVDETVLRQRAEEQMMRAVQLQQVFSDSRLQELRQQVDAGQLSEEQAREHLADILREHGMEPHADDPRLRYDNLSGGGAQEGVGDEREAYDPFEQMPESREQERRSPVEEGTSSADSPAR